MNTRTIPWGQIAVEAVAIVASVLLAFSIDAWWDNRKDLLEEQEILLGLEIEFVDLRESLTGTYGLAWIMAGLAGGHPYERSFFSQIRDGRDRAVPAEIRFSS